MYECVCFLTLGQLERVETMSMEYGSTKYNMIWAAQNRSTKLVLHINMVNVPELLGIQNMIICWLLVWILSMKYNWFELSFSVFLLVKNWDVWTPERSVVPMCVVHPFVAIGYLDGLYLRHWLSRGPIIFYLNRTSDLILFVNSYYISLISHYICML